MSEHTPGPWRVASDQNSVGKTVWAGDLPVAICSPMRVFLASRQTAQMTGAEASANARLIAAAPELLEALKEVRDRFFPVDQPERDRDLMWERVNAAIAYAEGST